MSRQSKSLLLLRGANKPLLHLHSPPSAHFPDSIWLENYVFTKLVYHGTLAAVNKECGRQLGPFYLATVLICIYFNPPQSHALINTMTPATQTPILSHLRAVGFTPNHERYRLSVTLLPFRFFHLLSFPQLSQKGFKPNSCLPHQTPTARAYKGKPSGASSSGDAEKLNNIVSRGRLGFDTQHVESLSSTFPPVLWHTFSPFPELHVL